MLQLPLNQLALLVTEITKQIKEDEVNKVKDSWEYYLHDFKLYPDCKEIPTLFIYQKNSLLLLINIFTPSFIEEIIHLPKHTYQIWGY